MEYTFYINSSVISLINITNGNRVTIAAADPRYERFKDLIKKGKYEEAEQMDVKAAVTSFVSSPVNKNVDFDIKINNGIGEVIVGGISYPLVQALVNRIIALKADGFSVEPLYKFVKNLYSNPSSTAINELYLFLEATGLPITDDGHFIAYKIVKNDYMDIYTGKIRNAVGDAPEMPRFSVDDNRNNTCSAGLHFCSKEYLTTYGSSNRDDDRCMLVKINPADVVSIPSDYNNAKGRTCKYVVVGEVQEKDWRTNLSVKDYNTKSVVKPNATEYSNKEVDLTRVRSAISGKFQFNTATMRWSPANSHMMVSRQKVIDGTGLSLAEIIDYESSFKK